MLTHINAIILHLLFNTPQKEKLIFMSKTLVLGIGNTLLSDEGIGVHIIHYLQQHNPSDDLVTFLDGGTLSFTLAADIESADNLIVVDAAQLNAPAGTIRVFEGSEMDHHLGTAKRSVHEVGLLDLLDIARLTDTLPGKRALVGIQPDAIDWGENPTPQVAASIEPAIREILKLIEAWQTVIPVDASGPEEHTETQAI